MECSNTPTSWYCVSSPSYSKDFYIGDVFIPKGRVVTVSTHLVHFNPSLYTNPSVFDPTRYSRGEGKGSTYLAFGGGHHKCLGTRLAEMELCVGVIMLLQRFRIQVTNGTAEEALRPENLRVLMGFECPLPPWATISFEAKQ